MELARARLYNCLNFDLERALETRSVTLCSQHFEYGSNNGHVFPVSRPLARMRFYGAPEAIPCSGEDRYGCRLQILCGDRSGCGRHFLTRKMIYHRGASLSEHALQI